MKKKKKVSYQDFFASDDVMVVLTTAPTGLGHLRVTEALRKGLSEKVRAEVVGLFDPSLQLLHRAASRNRHLRGLMEFVQNDPMVEKRFTKWYRDYLGKKGDEADERLVDLVKRRRPKPSTLVIVSTHFSLAHQIAAVKDQLARQMKMRVVLAVVVTDDSPQKIWGVFGADYVFVPSGSTRDKLMEYMYSISREIPEVIVSPYPVAEDFRENLSDEDKDDRKAQVKKQAKKKMKVVIPISGAAVQLDYFQNMIIALDKSRNVDITVVSRESSFTRNFLSWCQEQKSVRVVANKIDRDVVASYEQEFGNSVFSVEVTKPSEQTFKALLSPKQRGGVVLAFSDPVGRQEDDNLAFLLRHGLIPSIEERATLEKIMLGDSKGIDESFLEQAKSWRGIMLPIDGEEAGEAMLKLWKAGVFEAMVNFSGFADHPELNGEGVERFWERLAKEVGG